MSEFKLIINDISSFEIREICDHIYISLTHMNTGDILLIDYVINHLSLKRKLNS